MALPLTRDSVREAHEVIKGHVKCTPIIHCSTISRIASEPERVTGASTGAAKPRIRIFLKCENFQRVGAFKIRGAFHAISRLILEEGWLEKGGKEKGVVTHSSALIKNGLGNHAQALAFAAKELGLRATIVMPAVSAPLKIAATQGYGADIIFSGSSSQDREAAAERAVAETGGRLVPPYDHPDIILGQGTVGLEVQDQVPELLRKESEDKGQRKSGHGTAVQSENLDAIITPCGGGGLLSGVALSCEGTNIRVFGAEPSFEGADDARRGYYSHQRIQTVSSSTVCDGLRTPVGRIPFSIIHDRQLVSGMYSVSESEVLVAMRLLFERAKLVVEPSACVALAVVLFNEEFRTMVERTAGDRGWNIGVVLSGGNVGLEVLSALFAPETSSQT